MSVSDPVLYPAPQTTPEGLRQEAIRSRADLTRTLEELADRLSARRLARPVTLAPLGTGVAVAAFVFALLRRTGWRDLAWLGGLGAGVATGVATRRAARARPPRSPVGGPARVKLPATAAHADVVTILLEHHRRIESEFADVLAAEGTARVEAFASLVDLLQHHERVEQELVHPQLRSIAAGVADARLAEEDEATRALASLISLGVSNPRFVSGLIWLRDLVLDHAAREESQEFPLLRQHLGTQRLRELGGQVRWNG
jgi:hypothetical protein